MTDHSMKLRMTTRFYATIKLALVFLFSEVIMDLVQSCLKTPVGILYLVASSLGLRGVYLEKQKLTLCKTTSQKSQSTQILAQAKSELKEYFLGTRKSFSLPLDITGTPFQKKVWHELGRIPYGQTRSYGDIAKQIKHDKAYRAVGTANAKNPLCIIIPCHRVIAADQSLGGYSGGLQMKSKLLKLERA